MKKQIYKLVALLVFASVALSSCSAEYRERHHKTVVVVDDHHDHDHNYKQY